jgi:phosphate transport system substrate-binding protein
MGGKNGTNITKSAIVQSSTEAIKQSVKGDPNSIGFISLADLNGDVKAVKINGVTPSEATVKDGTYIVQRPFIFLTKGDAKGPSKDFIDWVLSPAGQAIVQQAGAVPIKPTT